MNWILVFLGGGTGAVARALAQMLVTTHGQPSHVGTMIINIIGCFIIGLLSPIFVGDSKWRMLLIVGFCGGFTTFSTFGADMLNLLKEGQYLWFSLYTVISVVVGLAAVILGVFLTKQILLKHV